MEIARRMKTPPDVTAWQPMDVESIQRHLGAFRSWCLCGGRSVDWILGRDTRPHGDTDIGVFRSDLGRCLAEIGASRVFLCSPPGGLLPWDGSDVPAAVHDVWIADPGGRHWILQIMVYDDAGDFVVYRRDPRVRWAKSHHSFPVRGVNVVNPLVTLLFKANKATLEPKDCHDIQRLIEGLGGTSWTSA
jgi:hypothetical protein